MDDANTTDADLIEAVRLGDEHAFQALCARYRGLLLHRVRRWLDGAIQRKVSVQDVLQEAYVVAFDRLGEFDDRGDGAFGAWLAQIAEFKAREAVRRHAGTAKRRLGREVSAAPGAEPAVAHDDAPTPSEVAIGREQQSAARAALKALPEDYRHVLTLVQVNGLPLADAAALLGRSYEATKKLYGRALSRYAEVLAVERRQGPRER